MCGGPDVLIDPAAPRVYTEAQAATPAETEDDTVTETPETAACADCGAMMRAIDDGFFCPDCDADEIGSCDVCGRPHENGSNLDHCPECGNCYDHCGCTPRRQAPEAWTRKHAKDC
jgi:predicted RNA-binding Zn-ribbon protein involved in translation (DUF1610 family)